MKKTELRKKYTEKRKTLSKDEVLLCSKKIAENFILQFKPTENQKVHVFLTIDKLKEIDTSFLINYCFEHKIRVFVPKIYKGKLISIELKKDTELQINSWGIAEPLSNADSLEKDFDFVITPLLYCDNQGNRVGYGKGFYDKLFAEISPKCTKIGVGFFLPDEEIDDVSDLDIPLDYLIVSDKILSFKGLL
ncbi:MAG: 5-formyltetrahydrofolate cyclo-ligase [Cruoricaptor ignavus]|nr:5-formyltetrahydrofolate cyclo-ligase [Cruoricaptor ignavus]